MTNCDTARFTNLGDGIIHIDAEYMKPELASVYFIIEGDECAIVETGNYQTVEVIHQVLEAHDISLEQVRYIIPTHVHLDHAGGVAKLQAGASAVYGEEAFKRLYGDLIPVEATRVITPEDNETLQFGSRVLRFYDTPGHARPLACWNKPWIFICMLPSDLETLAKHVANKWKMPSTLNF